MNILFWVPYPTEGASNRYRVEQYLAYLDKEKIGYALRPFWTSRGYSILYRPGYFFQKVYCFIRGSLSRLTDIFHINRYDMVFIHREAYPIGGAFLERVLKWIGKPYIFDFDDAIFLPSSSEQNTLIKYLKIPGKIKKIIIGSKHVIAGNDYLAGFAGRFNKNVTVIPTSVDLIKYQPDKKKAGGEIVIGWIGSGTTFVFINLIIGTMKKLSGKYNNITFKLIGGNFEIHGMKNIINRSWSLKSEIDELRTFDIGVTPMREDEWTLGKCGFKTILYMSMGIPCVASPVGVIKDIIDDGENGFLAGTEEEWLRKLSLLIENPELREKLGSAGRKTVEDRYSVEVNAPKFLDVIKKVYQESRGSR